MGKILVVDDEESIRFTFETFLSDEGHGVATASSYSEAVARISETEYDLIFADIILGDRTGIDLLHQVRERNLTSIVVIITGYPNIETATEAVRLGAFEYIPKPVRQETLLSVARKALRHKALYDEKERYRTNLDVIFRSVRDGIIMVDKDLKVVEFNEAAENICGLSRDRIGNLTRSVPLEPDAPGFDLIQETVQTKQCLERSGVECYVHEPRHVLTLNTAPLLDHRGSFLGSVLVLRDETRLAVLERDLNERKQFHSMIGRSEIMQKVYALIEDLADVETTVLITGESATGKELVAEALHHTGSRRGKPLVKVNCSALSENLLESELFGHVKGAFTGAIKDKVGRFQRADGGTIFLDEIGDISPNVQLRLLRVLERKEFEKVGDSAPVRVDVRVVAATHQNLREKIGLGKFREDLYYRLKVVELALPPLRERSEDIPLLAEHFVKVFNKRFNKRIAGVSEDVRRLFMEYPWPGNIRELEHVIEHAFVVCSQETITTDHLPAEIQEFLREKLQRSANPIEESRAILQAIEKAGGNKARAARLLGISRRTIYRKMKEHGIETEEE
ncbi:MAG: response regulator [Deltaproteobacteria bacterium]|nr:MAG: response regulator [Deltaproteobacteria bacterium]